MEEKDKSSSGPVPRQNESFRWGEPIEPGKPVAIDTDGIVVAGKYIGFSSFLQEGTARESRIHEVELSETGWHVPGDNYQPGDSFRFWGSYDLDQKLRRVEDGEVVRIEYKGKEELPGGREMKRFEVRRALQRAKPRGGTDNPPF